MNQAIRKRIEDINNGIVPEGYKQTPFGIFPCDWETDNELINFCEINPKTGKLDEEFVYIDLESVVDGKLIQKNIIRRCDAPSRAQRVLSEDDVLYQMVRPYQKNNFIFHHNEWKIQTVASTGYAQLRNDNPTFLYQLINSEYFCAQVVTKCTGTNYPAINSEDLGKVIISFPKDKIEQRKIAEILMKWDEAVELQEQYIQKLELRKKHIEKELISKKSEKVVDLQELCTITTGKLDANAQVEGGKYPFFTCAKEIFGIDSYAFEGESLLVSGNGAHVGYIHYYNGRFNAYQRTYVLQNCKCNIKFLKCFLDMALPERLIKEKNEGNTPYIVYDTLAKMKIWLPSSIEQERVSTILCKVDEEIALQKEKLEKIKIQRKAMQQYLLTGIVRV